MIMACSVGRTRGSERSTRGGRGRARQSEAESVGGSYSGAMALFNSPHPHRDSPQLGTFAGSYEPAGAIRAASQNGRPPRAVGEPRSSPSRDLSSNVLAGGTRSLSEWEFSIQVKATPGSDDWDILRDASRPNGMKLVVAREALEVLRRYQFDNPNRAEPACRMQRASLLPVLRAASQLEWKIHWDEVNRELMWVMKDADLGPIIDKIRTAPDLTPPI